MMYNLYICVERIEWHGVTASMPKNKPKIEFTSIDERICLWPLIPINCFGFLFCICSCVIAWHKFILFHQYFVQIPLILDSINRKPRDNLIILMATTTLSAQLTTNASYESVLQRLCKGKNNIFFLFFLLFFLPPPLDVYAVVKEICQAEWNEYAPKLLYCVHLCYLLQAPENLVPI